MPEVSVIVPAYNAREFLEECLESIVNQSFKDIEVLVVDDGSTDGTAEIAESFCKKDSRVRLLRKENGGLSDARNYGIDRSLGKYICFVDADDCIFDYSIEVLLNGVKETNCKISCGLFTRKVYLKHQSQKNIKWQIIDWRTAVNKLLYQEKIDCTACAKLYKKELFDNFHFRKGLKYEDLDLTYRLIEEAQEIAFTNTVIYYYRQNPKSITGSFSTSRFDVLDVTKRIEEYMTENHPELIAAARDRRLSANFNMLGLIALNDKRDEFKDIADECYSLIKRYRWSSLTNPKVRLKNKAGILLSYLGKKAYQRVAKLYYR